MTATETLLSVKAAASYLGISPGTLRNWLRSGQFDLVKVGRLTKVKQTDLDAYIEARTVRGPHR